MLAFLWLTPLKFMKKMISRRNMLLGLTATAGGLAGLGAFKTFNEPGASQPDIIKKEGLSEPTGQMTYRINKNSSDKVSLLGFGCMRYPVMPGEKSPRSPNINEREAQALIDYAFAHGVNYFDTAWGYHNGASQIFTGSALKRYPRDKFFLATKMPSYLKPSLAQAKEIFATQLRNCQVEYFDYYLLHTLSTVANYQETYEREGVLDYLLEEKKQGRIRNLGWSFHGDAPMLEYVLSRDIPWDFGMIQINYHDLWHKYEPNPNIKRNTPEPAPVPWMFEKMVASGLPLIIMEPLLGGRLARLNHKAVNILQSARPQDSAAAWAFRYVAGLPNILTILSGMTYMEHLQENLQTFSPFEPLSAAEEDVLKKSLQAFINTDNIRCTTCGYCMPCPYGVDIPAVFRHHNNCLDDDLVPRGVRSAEYEEARHAYLASLARKVPELATASHCTGCGQCLPKCPQFIDIPKEMAALGKLIHGLREV
ncbi:MAG: aldo/keto reductase [Desulfovibrionaceae bacterium]|nr:aldo/keto reductase [Desulfovibrionaceae bacterium]